jgi:aspartate kinase
VPNARKIDFISYDEMLELASLGANVLHNRAVEFAKKYNVPIHVRNSQNKKKGTMIVAESESMERVVVSGVALKDKLARITLRNVPDIPGLAATIFQIIATHSIIVDDIIQTIADNKTATVAFTVDISELSDARKVVEHLALELECDATFEDHLAKVSAVGMGMRIHTGVAERMFAALAAGKINIQNITTSEIKISVLIDRSQGPQALRLVHDAFDLGTAPTRPAPSKRAAKKPGKAKKTGK